MLKQENPWPIFARLLATPTVCNGDLTGVGVKPDQKNSLRWLKLPRPKKFLQGRYTASAGKAALALSTSFQTDHDHGVEHVVCRHVHKCHVSSTSSEHCQGDPGKRESAP